MATIQRFDKDGFRAVEAGRDEAGRLVAAVRRFRGASGNEVGSEQATAVHDLRSDASLGRAWLLAVPGAMDAGLAAPLF